MIREYTDQDFEAVVQIFRLNSPRFFHPSEENDLIHYLKHEKEDYFVVEENGIVVGSGGINYCVGENKELRFSWDMIRPDKQGERVGSRIVEYRINWVKSHSKEKLVVVRTSQLAYCFYQRFGFKLQTVTKDFWAKGLDLYLMHLKLS